MLPLSSNPPVSSVEPVTEILHGVAVTDPYRWLEDQESPRTRKWLGEQMQYTRNYLDAIPGRKQIRDRVRALLDVETYDSILIGPDGYVFRKRVPRQEQPCIYLRHEGTDLDELLVDPMRQNSDAYTSVRPLRLSLNGRLLLYEVKKGGERTGRFELFDIRTRQNLPDHLPHGYLRGFCFAPDSQSFYYIHESAEPYDSRHLIAFQHVLGDSHEEDRPVFHAGDSLGERLLIIPGEQRLGFVLLRFAEKTLSDFYLWTMTSSESPQLLVKNAGYRFGPVITKDKLLAITDRDAPNFRVVEVCPGPGGDCQFINIVAEREAAIRDWAPTSDRIYVSYLQGIRPEIKVFDLAGKELGNVPVTDGHSVRIVGARATDNSLFFEQESFTNPVQICRYSPKTQRSQVWAERKIPFDSAGYAHRQVWFPSTDGTQIPMFLVGRPEVLNGGPHPAIMTSYGGYGLSMTPRFSVFVSFLLEQGCLFALPNIRGGSEFGVQWHHAARRQKRQVAFDDFLAAAEWLIAGGKTTPQQLAIFGGSNSGLLVGTALTQRPELFQAVLCMVPMLDMVRYHLFDHANVWAAEFGTADNPRDFAALWRYSPYHRVKQGISYPATMIVSGDADQNCNPLHARKMVARLQAASVSRNKIFLDYSRFRGHSPVLPLSMRIAALTDRLAFLCDRLDLSM